MSHLDTKEQAEHWKRIVVSHFCCGYGSGFRSIMDRDVFLAEALCGAGTEFHPQDILPPGSTQAEDPLIAVVLKRYKTKVAVPNDVVIIKTMTPQSHRIHTQKRKSSGAVITYSTAASSVYALLSMLLAEYLDAQKALGTKDWPSEEARLLKLMNFSCGLMLDWKANGQIFFLKDIVEAFRHHNVHRASVLFHEAITFAIAHELAHCVLSHVDNPTDNISEMQQRELHADEHAISVLLGSEYNPVPINPYHTLGPLIVFLAKSLLSPEPDHRATETHPPLTLRMHNYIEQMIGESPHPDLTAQWAYQDTLIPALYTFLGLGQDGRDRRHEWGLSPPDPAAQIAKSPPGRSPPDIFTEVHPAKPELDDEPIDIT